MGRWDVLSVSLVGSSGYSLGYGRGAGRTVIRRAEDRRAVLRGPRDPAFPYRTPPARVAATPRRGKGPWEARCAARRGASRRRRAPRTPRRSWASARRDRATALPHVRSRRAETRTLRAPGG